MNIKAGAGKAEIKLPEDFFPVEGFTGIRDPLHVRALVVEQDIRLVIVSLELTSLREYEIRRLKGLISGFADTAQNHIWICVTHTFSAPHVRSEQAIQDPVVCEKNEQLCTAIEAAAAAAVRQAVGKLQPVTVQVGTGKCVVNINRDEETAAGWWKGRDAQGFSDKSLPVVSFRREDGNLVAVLFSYDVQSAVMEGVRMPDGGKAVSADLAGAAMLEAEAFYGDEAVALFLPGAAGDQAPVSRVLDDSAASKLHPGRELGQQVIHTLGHLMQEIQPDPVEMQQHTVGCAGQQQPENMRELKPVRRYQFQPDKDRETIMEVIRIGGIAIIGVRPELNSITGAQIRTQSPFPQTIVATLVNGGEKYMADRQSYDRITYEAMNSGFARGSAERLTEKVLKVLNRLAANQ